jgi:predicted transcriptional regulator
VIVYDTNPLYRNETNQTRLRYEANLTHRQTVKYLRTLVDLGMLILTDLTAELISESKSGGYNFWNGKKIIPINQWKKIANTNYAFSPGPLNA